MGTDYQLLYEQLFDKVPVMLHLLDEDGLLRDVNDWWLETLGYTKEEVIGTDPRDFTTLESHQQIDEQLNPTYRKEGQISNFPCQLTKKNGEIIEVLLSSYAERGSNGRIVQTYGVIINISESRELRHALTLSDHILENVKNVVLVADQSGAITYVSPFTEAYLDYEPGTLLGDGWWKHARRERWEEDKQRVASEASGEQEVATYPYETTVYDANGDPYVFLFRDSLGPNGTVLGVGYDVTERNAAVEMLQKVNGRMRFMLGLEKKILAAESWRTVVYHVLDGVSEHLSYCQRISFSVFDEANDLVKFHLFQKADDETVPEPKQLPLSHFSSYQDLSQGGYRLVPDLEALDSLSETDQTIKADGVRSYLLMPVIWRQRLVGSLNIGSHDVNPFSQEDIHLVEEIANEIGSALIRHELNDALEEKNKQIERQNRDITDSIRYAKRIQESFFPTRAFNEISMHNDSFVFFEPKHIVSGDFFWVGYEGNDRLFAVGDCTGHGVPGAMLSIVGFNLLNQAVHEEGLVAPDDILNHITQQYRKSFLHDDDQELSDGMSLGICRLRVKEGILEFCGANHSMHLVSGNRIQHYKGQRIPIGDLRANEHTYERYIINVKKGDSIYLSTDGYLDQFGGPDNRKFRLDRFEQLLLNIRNHSVQEQKVLLEEKWREWRGDEDQTDDICIVGVVV